MIPKKTCNVCGADADFLITLEELHAKENTYPFYVCQAHEAVYNKMTDSVERKHYFPETQRAFV